jgi:cell division protein FtsI/penicillin-binding protein 2
MNQILQTENKKSAPVEINKVILFFAIAVVIFGIVLICGGLYAVNNTTKDEEENQTQQQPTVEESKPDISVTREDDKLLLDITHNKSITSVTYKWNDETEQEIETNDSLTVSEQITIPFGTNTIYITVIDKDGQETNYVNNYTQDGDGKPVIELLLTNENKIRIKVQDSQGLKYIRYTWNSGNYVMVEANVEDLKLIDETVEIPLGQNTLRVEAVNIDDMITVKELEVKGVKRPVVSLRQDGSELIINVQDEVGLKVINFTLNGIKYQIPCADLVEASAKVQLQQGENKIELTAENKDDGITQINGKCIVE